ncbi:protein SCAR3 isoform X2 [Cornus florida]|uniref:protein SCAR3 isoform X2 n=1 Tax=Cornus florida TaxID=4283 RepID=UPI0028A28FF1|nr:protein SCAR3 isoform X2 [Cornus florida]
MPLVRVQVRNEYGLGSPELYKEANREDPKDVLDGVAVSGLVGILRQLGDLAEFAAEVFHGLQEQIMTTSSKSHKLMVRVRHIEAALPPLEKMILTQRSHLHFAYTAGFDWHACIQNKQNHFIYNDLPRFIMDSYEECRDPPCLHLLDKFDTGGPGSCLKRYSDPTFFKRASASPDEAYAEKVPRDKKVRRSKKRTLKTNGKFSRSASISNHSGRMQFTSSNVDEQTSQDFSTFDATLKSDLENQFNSFDSRPGSDYIECVFQPSYAMKPEEHEPKKISSSKLKMDYDDTPDLVFDNGRSGVLDDEFPQSSSQEQTGPSSSCVTWDEKTEIVDPTGQQFESDGSPEVLPTNIDLDTLERNAVNFGSVNQTAIRFDNGITTTSISGGNQLEDIESETDNYMDALNTIESECETDLDCQTKREVEHYSNFNDEEIEDGMHGLRAHYSDDYHPSNFGSHTEACNPLNNETSLDKSNSISSESYAHEPSSQRTARSSIPSNTPGIDFCENAEIIDVSNVESVISNAASDSGSPEPNSHAPTSDKIISSCESQKSPTELSGVQSVTFWTNGFLLGLEPSKPPDFNISNAASRDSMARSKDEIIGPSSESNIIMGNGLAGTSDMLVKCSESIEHDSSSKCSTSYHNDEEYAISIKKTSQRFSPADLIAKLEKSGDVHLSDRFNYVHQNGLNETSVVTPGTKQSVSPSFKAITTGARLEDGEKSSQMLGLGERVLNSFQRKVSLARDENHEPASSANTGVFEQKSRNQCVAYGTSSETHFKEHFGGELPVNSPSSSPTLEHMKISFQPMNKFEISKLTLKFPDRSHSRESGRDMFPSFQLVPEPAIPLHDDNSHSDDDTFCRSSPYMSDDDLSEHSESNSEQWESGETPQSKDHELYDALCRISSTESVSSSLEFERTAQAAINSDCGLRSQYAGNGVQPSQSDHLLDLPSFDALNPLFKQEIENCPDAKDLLGSQFPKDPMPPPPPLPPLQWRGMKSHSDVTEDKEDTVSEPINYALDMKPLGYNITSQSKASRVKQEEDVEEVVAFIPTSKQPEQQKLNGWKEANQFANAKEMDEKEDFLHQIRTKSLSLRRTVTAKPSLTPGPATNVKVTAILEKANAIRQAVGSDDGEDDDDDNWSDI